MLPILRRGLMFILSSPSGAGKTTLANRILQSDELIKVSVSVTTRPPRHGEIDGIDYHFVTKEKYLEMLENDQFLEHAEIFGYYYGTPKNFVFDQIAKGNDVLFDIDWQGTQQIRQISRDDLATVFILPPSMTVLEARLKGRNQDDNDIIQRRMNEAANEISHWAEYDYVIINQDLDKSTGLLQNILKAERIKRRRLTGMAEFVNALRGKT